MCVFVISLWGAKLFDNVIFHIEVLWSKNTVFLEDCDYIIYRNDSTSIIKRESLCVYYKKISILLYIMCNNTSDGAFIRLL